MKQVFKKIGKCAVMVAVSLVPAMFVTGDAFAVSAGDMAQYGTGQANNIVLLLQALAAIVGVVFIVGGFMAIRAANKTEGQQVKYSAGIVGVLVGCALFYLSSVIQTGGDSLWQGGGNRSQLTITQ